MFLLQELIHEQSTAQQQSLGEYHATIKTSQGNNVIQYHLFVYIKQNRNTTTKSYPESVT